ncbi:unnamed protein product [Lasius platythorax]|uniref:Uncharacterized protein n=1 Tax=Lasius platythorax TaxID=488582 RepID=A0AAV2P537_9HYME
MNSFSNFSLSLKAKGLRNLRENHISRNKSHYTTRYRILHRYASRNPLFLTQSQFACLVHRETSRRAVPKGSRRGDKKETGARKRERPYRNDRRVPQRKCAHRITKKILDQLKSRLGDKLGESDSLGHVCIERDGEMSLQVEFGAPRYRSGTLPPMAR